MGRDWCSSASLAAFNHGNQKSAKDDDVENHGSCAKCPFYLRFLKREKWSVASEQGVPFELTVPLKLLR